MVDVALISAALSVTGKVLDKLPNYTQKQKNEYKELCLSYIGMLKKKIITVKDGKIIDRRDDDLLLNLRDEIKVWTEAIDKKMEQ